MAISLTSTYFVVMLVDLLFGFRVSRACELIGLDTGRFFGLISDRYKFMSM